MACSRQAWPELRGVGGLGSIRLPLPLLLLLLLLLLPQLLLLPLPLRRLICLHGPSMGNGHRDVWPETILYHPNQHDHSNKHLKVPFSNIGLTRSSPLQIIPQFATIDPKNLLS